MDSAPVNSTNHGWNFPFVVCGIHGFKAHKYRGPTTYLPEKKKIRVWVDPHSSNLCCSRIKTVPANAGEIRETGSIPGSGRSPGGGNGNPLQYSCLQNPMDSGAWRAIVHRFAKIQAWLKWQYTWRWKLSTAWECQFSKNQVISISNICTISSSGLGGLFCRSSIFETFPGINEPSWHLPDSNHCSPLQKTGRNLTPDRSKSWTMLISD